MGEEGCNLFCTGLGLVDVVTYLTYGVRVGVHSLTPTQLHPPTRVATVIVTAQTLQNLSVMSLIMSAKQAVTIMETALPLTTVTVTKMEVDALAMVLAPAFLAAGNREVPVPCQMRVLVCVRCTFAG